MGMARKRRKKELWPPHCPWQTRRSRLPHFVPNLALVYTFNLLASRLETRGQTLNKDKTGLLILGRALT